jgi:SulP family sulfate permease
MNPDLSIRPKLFDAFRHYSARDLKTDFVAGVTVCSVALPLSMAFATASGVKPELGLLTAIIGGFIVALFSGSPVQIGGPTGAFVIPRQRWQIATVGTQYGMLGWHFPRPGLPSVEIASIPELLRPSFTIALLVAMQALLCAVVTDGMLDHRHDSNKELMAQGVANMTVGLFGCIPVTGAVARSVLNVSSGGRTPVAGMIHSILILALLVVAAPLISHVPLATLSAILVYAAYNMAGWSHFARLFRWPRSDSAVFLITLGLTVFANLTIAVEVGVVLSALLLMNRISETTQITAVDERTETEGSQHSLVGREIPNGVLIYRVFGAFFFGAVDKLNSELKRAKREPDALILRVRKVLAIDATSLQALEDLNRRLRAKGKHLVLSAPHTQPLATMEGSGFIDRLGRENVCPHIEAALDRAREVLGLPPAPKTDPLQDERRRIEAARQELHTPEAVLECVVEPAGLAVMQISLAARRFQHGRIQAYIFYVVAGLVALGGLVIMGGGK